MQIRLFFILTALFGSCVSGCTRVRYMQEIYRVSYTEQSGTISPEMQLSERIVITSDQVTLTRKGKTADTTVNEGVWKIQVDEQETKKLFEHLQTVDCSSIKRVEPDELEIGGGTRSYDIVYAGDKTFSLDYGRGVTYTDGALLVEPIDTFIKNLVFPAGATMQYKH